MNWKRLIGVVMGFVLWAILDALTGEPHNAEMALLAGFVVAWVCEKSNG